MTGITVNNYHKDVILETNGIKGLGSSLWNRRQTALEAIIWRPYNRITLVLDPAPAANFGGPRTR